ncbi:hypothetical protein GCM10011515_10530 [Tsuneonella deserti]|uniref:Lysoplasmalogenase n=1 Tax=Tsuneonella deserti TaxID=2035528 RepID=A0ABQ1S661_9SPHN|nr:lysoplasmalogenase family protein [Tsuneonella deserti]GGD92699.1 hypothetical protein GCM10011515_10530 [Tsuneonella deserti]
MPKRALIESRPWLVLGVALALAFWVLSDSALGGLFQMALKGGSVAALAAYALSRSSARDARLIAAVMAIGAAGDIGMELDTVAGGALFLLSHLVAIVLYLRNRRPHPALTQRAAAAALLAGVPLTTWLIARDPMPVLYSVSLAAMAATAWMSRFSRYNVGIGALLFVASDLLIFARLGGALDPSLTEWLVWPLYYAGQLMICTGVIRTLRRDHQA